jgi:outer membrane protein TolC
MEKSMTTLSNTENALKMQAQNAKLNFNFANENVITMKKNMELADKIQQKTLIKYKEGVSSSLDLNQAQMQYLNAQSNYINGLYSLITAKNDLDKAYGTIQPAAPNAVPNK